MSKQKINVLVDWGKSFVDEDGSFYCGTTQEQKNNAAKIIKSSDLVIELSDTHGRNSTEFIPNGGLYPAHNLVKKDWIYAKELGVENGKNVSPRLTETLQNALEGRSSGLIAPRHIFFQDYDGGDRPNPSFTFNDVLETYGVDKLDPTDFLDGKIDHIIQAKQYFDGTRTNPTEWMGALRDVPDREVTAFSLLEQMYGKGENLQFDITGVVVGICVYNTGVGIRQMFPKSEVNIIADAVTHLAIPELGIKDEAHGDAVANAMLKQVGVNYIKTKDYFER